MTNISTTTDNRMIQIAVRHDKNRQCFAVSAFPVTLEGGFITCTASEMGNGYLFLDKVARDNKKKRTEIETNWKNYPEIVSYINQIAEKYNLIIN
jgi:hypothetical protein